jgi:hypothetical protein
MAVLRTVAEEIRVRRLVTAVVVAAMVVLSGCGRQVTGLDIPNGVAGVAPGQTLIRFETNGPLDFQNLSYLIVLNTSGNGNQPYAQGFNSDFKDWTHFFIVGGGANFANSPQLNQVYLDPTTGSPTHYAPPVPVGFITFLPSTPSANSQFAFQITFNRCVLDVPPPSRTAQPPVCTNGTGPPFNFIASNWNISLFTLDKTLTPVDSLGTNGPFDTSYKPFIIDTTQPVNTNYFKPGSGSSVSNPSASIVGVEVLSAPSNNPPVPIATPSPTPTPTGRTV